tara:strand:+ start:229 stop:1128 length:900 start_codon:yes stop_codon:yes gene_type:complete
MDNERVTTMLDPELEFFGPVSDRPQHPITPDTYPHGQVLRELGGEWDEAEQAWRFSKHDRPASLDDLMARHPPPPRGRGPAYWSRYRWLEQRLLEQPSTMPEHELLELLLSFSVPLSNAEGLAPALIARFRSLGAAVASPPQRLLEFDKVNHHSVILFRLVRELAIRLAKENVVERQVVDGKNLMAYLRTAMANETEEQLRMLSLDTKNQLIADDILMHGDADSIPLRPRKVAKRALELDATKVILVHNHPSGDHKPSKEDIQMTRRIKTALSHLGVTLSDHIIIGRSGSTSFRESGNL